VRLPLVALAIVLADLYVLLRRVVANVREYGTRKRILKFTQEQMVSEIQEYISNKLGLRKVSYCRALQPILCGHFVFYRLFQNLQGCIRRGCVWVVLFHLQIELSQSIFCFGVRQFIQCIKLMTV
jgi:hypothetical protein